MEQIHHPTEHNAGPSLQLWALLTDPWIVAALALSVLMVGLYTLPILTPDRLVFFADFIALLLWMILAIAALVSGVRDIPSSAERRFWWSLAFACSFWALSELIAATGILDTSELPASVLIDCLYYLYYLGWLSALEACPHLEPERREERQLRNFSWVGRLLFVTGLFAYFVLIPTVFEVDIYTTWIPSFLFYLSMDVYLVVRFIVAFAASTKRRWRIIYALLGGAAFLVGVTDLFDAFYMAWIVEYNSGGPLDALWYAPFFLIILAARTRQIPIDDPDARDRRFHPAPKGVPLLAYSFAFPVIHFVLRLFGNNPPELETAREVLILAWLFLLGAVNTAQYIWLGQWNRELQERRRRAEDRALLLSRQDALTGLLNRRELEPILRQAISAAKLGHRQIALLFVDLDGFKQVNDSFGHSKGDTVLQAVAERVKHCVRDTDSAVRYGGDEFVLVLEDIEDLNYAKAVAMRVLSTLSKDIRVDGRPIELGASIGISLYPGDGETPSALIDHADSRMYLAKAEGGARYRYASDR